MFADGVALEVDVDEERVEMVEHDGSFVRSGSFLLVRLMAQTDEGMFRLFVCFRRYTVRECSASRKVGDRMKVFRKFLPLFDESDS